MLRELGLVQLIGAHDAGDVPQQRYRDVQRPRRGIRNEAEVGQFSRELATGLAHARQNDEFLVVLGGDCSIILGCLLGAAQHHRTIGLAYIDAHADFGTPEESLTGSAASMCLALAVGRGDSELARLNGDAPLAAKEHVVLIGRRDHGQSYYGHAALRDSGILDLAHEAIQRAGVADVSERALQRLTAANVDGYWIHVDADVLDPSVMPAVDSPEPNGLSLPQLVGLLRPLVHHPKALGMQITIYDPSLDPNRTAGTHLVALVHDTLRPLPC